MIKLTFFLFNLVLVATNAGAGAVEGHSLRSGAGGQRQLGTQDDIIDYTPTTVVTDDAAIDLDQALFESELDKINDEGFENAFHVYTLGAFSQSYATLTLNRGLTFDVPEGTDIDGNNTDGNYVRGRTMKAANAGATTLKVRYHVYPVQRAWTACHVGGNPNPNFQRCYAPTGTIEIDGMGLYEYSYNQAAANNNTQTLQTLSADLKKDDPGVTEKISSSDTFQKFYDYYGVPDYGNQVILTAFFKTATHDFKNGDFYFYNYKLDGRAEAAKRATIYLNVWMAVVLEMEHAVHMCEKNDPTKPKDLQLYAWDKAVAFYTGSVAKQADGEFFKGHTLYTLAEEQCLFSGTCTDAVEIVSGQKVQKTHADVNLKIFNYFNSGQRSLLDGDCGAAKADAMSVIHQMQIPLIQGLIRYAYAMDLGYQSNDASHDFEAAGAVFSAAVLPLIHHCDATAAQSIYQNMRVANGVGTTSYDTVMTLLEKNLDCLGVTCDELGGVMDIANSDRIYMPGGEPCHHPDAPPANNDPATVANTAAPTPNNNVAATVYTSDPTGGPNVKLAVGVTLLLVVLALVVAVVASRARNQKEFDGPAHDNEKEYV
ncbi:expressed unknown protein [Seminavis robusta]|uniref:Uncharacterized protein n=1 Tax=Seminavis robusta TaxID=568900 RepID=A0A9N8DQ46_9STRA|nr:expressed unknown protein [Seminavis robusta]|eukprot:Sro275_g105640.1 n/a (597) ;mRNA; f:14781-16756